MKKTLLLSLLVVGLLNLTAIAGIVNIDDARHAAKNVYFEKTGTKQASIEISQEYTELINDAPAYYIFNINNEGFVIIAAEDNVTPILAYSTETTYNFNNSFAPHKAWMQNYTNQISAVRENNLMADTKIEAAWTKYKADFKAFTQSAIEKVVDPLLGDIVWDQGAGWNDSCPFEPASLAGNDHVYAGCVATATGMIMKYHSFPAQGTGSHSYDEDDYGTLSANFGATTYQWASMPANAPTGYTAQLLFHIGVAVEMDYEYDGAGSYNVDAIAALKNYFSYDPAANYVLKADYTSGQWITMLKDNLDESMPLLYAGQSAADGSHSFVCDGYDASDMFHFNWGYSGDFNGYFELTNLNPGTLNYTEMQAAGFDIKPGPEGIATLANRNADLAVYPNPAQDFVKLSLDAGIKQIIVTDATGRILNKENFESTVSEATLNLSHFATGIYFIKVDASEHTYIQKIMVK